MLKTMLNPAHSPDLNPIELMWSIVKIMLLFMVVIKALKWKNHFSYIASSRNLKDPFKLSLDPLNFNT